MVIFVLGHFCRGYNFREKIIMGRFGKMYIYIFAEVKLWQDRLPRRYNLAD